MKTKPAWVIRKNRRYKVVTADLCSVCHPSWRWNVSGNRSVGQVLQYKIGQVKRSPNGVDMNNNITCARGMHAYTDYKSARGYHHCCGCARKIIVVYAPKWYGHYGAGKQRASQIYVSSVSRQVLCK